MFRFGITTFLQSYKLWKEKKIMKKKDETCASSTQNFQKKKAKKINLTKIEIGK